MNNQFDDLWAQHRRAEEDGTFDRLRARMVTSELDGTFDRLRARVDGTTGPVCMEGEFEVVPKGEFVAIANRPMRLMN